MDYSRMLHGVFNRMDGLDIYQHVVYGKCGIWSVLQHGD